ncbi:breast carcinoma-amplified sequence 1 isoform X3 [Dromaius novaehollandiae]|uniref:Brain enriched myelin associated protein 1 n=1 Tax=Dromaius novaehollandiae TaxID=8790 RepID=A0A8C4J5W8_DRONO|nr:breast carcinoma-amplified sequence 1 isoform X3 [Dromaius novaehollandiae]
MGNTLSVPESSEEDNTCTIKSYQAISESPDNIKNGSVAVVQATSPTMNGKVDAKASVARDNVAVSSPKTMEISSVSDAGGKNLGNDAKKTMPSAKSRSVFAFSWPVPGRTEDQATDSSAGSAKLDVSSETPEVNKALSQSVEFPAAAALEQCSHKNLTQAPPAASLSEVELAAPGTPEGEDAAASESKQVTFFDRIFKLEKKKERSKTQIDTQEEGQASDTPDGSIPAKEAVGLQSTSSSVPQRKEIDDCNQKDIQQDAAGVNCATTEQPEKAEVKQENPQAAAAVDKDNSVMSFLKTLVSPSKADAKSDSEDKAAKEAQQTTNTKSTEQQPVTSVKSEKNTPSSQEPQTTKHNAKAPEPAAQQQAAAAATEAPKELTKEKASSAPMPLSKLFRKKNPLEEAEIVSNEKADTSLEAVAPDKDESKSPEASEVKPRREEIKTPKANLRKFFKLSVKGDGGTTKSEEVNGPNPNHQTSNSTERPVGPAESEPVGQKSKESSKDKKSTVELSKQKGNKQETREQPDSREQQTTETESIQNGGDTSKEPSSKKTEKRQSFGGFLKGLGPKRMSDAEVQTDPVSILPAGKSK